MTRARQASGRSLFGVGRAARARAWPARAALALAALALAGCEELPSAKVDKDESYAVNAIDENNLNQIMLTVADADSSVEYFRNALLRNPDRIDIKRDYARALMRARRYSEARALYRDLDETGEATADDRVEYAHALARLGEWRQAEAQLAMLPPGYGSPRERLLLAMMADQRGDWAAADQAYAQAKELSVQPAPVLNNWGVSLMARRDYKGAERAFEEALVYDPTMFNAKNNLTLVYGLQKRYRLPLVNVNESERAILLHNLAVLALRHGDTAVARGLLREAVDVAPSYYAPAAEKLAALEAREG